MLLADEDVGDGALLGHLLESVLDGGTIICGQLLGMITLVNVDAWVLLNIPTWSSSMM